MARGKVLNKNPQEGDIKIMPSNPNDAYHLLKQSLHIDTPTIFIEHKYYIGCIQCTKKFFF